MDGESISSYLIEEEYVWFYRGFEMNMGREGEGDLRNKFQEVESSRGR